jgi:nicotinate-nucleotide pyrophosphorylase (carboxylating)
MSDPFHSDEVRRLILLAIEEDLGSGDVTSELTIPPGARARADVVVREKGVIAGLPLVAPVTREFDPDIRVELRSHDGAAMNPGDVVAVVSGPARAILSAERTVLNFLQRLSGVATLTRRFVDAVAGTRAAIFDTRKTTPGWRVLEKYAVTVGGGRNHRMGLFDQVLIKDNHRAMMARENVLLSDVVELTRAKHPDMLIEVEADDADDVRDALASDVDIILLDNMTPDAMRRATALADDSKRRPLFEASGGVTIEDVRAIGRTGVDRISVGALTHSAKALDIAIDFEVL